MMILITRTLEEHPIELGVLPVAQKSISSLTVPNVILTGSLHRTLGFFLAGTTVGPPTLGSIPPCLPNSRPFLTPSVHIQRAKPPSSATTTTLGHATHLVVPESIDVSDAICNTQDLRVVPTYTEL